MRFSLLFALLVFAPACAVGLPDVDDAGGGGGGGPNASSGGGGASSGGGGSGGGTSASGGGSPAGGGTGGGGAASGGAGGGSGVGGNGGGTACVKRTCQQAGADCGSTSDGCGGTLSCGACGEGWVCGADVLNKCGWLKTRVDPQYLAVNKASTSTNTCCRWTYDDPASINGNAVDEIRNALYVNGATARQDTANSKRRLAVTFILQYLEATDAQEDQVLQNLFALARQKDMPVLFKLDGVSWWENRGDLWNFWDPSKPGYKPENANNVEWTGWDSSQATKLAWRDWGLRIRIKPHPNLASPVYIAEKKAAVRRLTQVIARWVKSLPVNQRYLFAGLVLDNELSIGVNHFYYVNGNASLNGADPPTNTPLATLGYAAVKGYGIASSGTITAAQKNEAVRRHMQMLVETARAAGLEEGIDLFHKLYTHGFADQNGVSAFPFSNMVTNAATPGWSFYEHAWNPAYAIGLSSALDQVASGVNGKWGAVEWLYIGGLPGSTFSQWEAAFRNTFGYRNNRLINIHNWEGIFAPRPPAQPQLDALANAALESLGCLVSEPIMEEPVVNGTQVTLRWMPGADTGAMFFNLSSSGALTNAGTLANPDVANDVVTGVKTVTKTMAPGTYYWSLVADGCSPSQRAASEVKRFVVK